VVPNLNSVIRYFDILSKKRPLSARPYSSDGKRKLHWLPQWIALYLGIVTQRFFADYIKTGAWHLAGFWGWAIAGGVIALMAFPAVYKSSIDPEQNLFVQFCVIFAAGMGWQSMVQVGGTGAVKIITGG